jgi:ABC-type uncharacterized transport system substrate-binding protein
MATTSHTYTSQSSDKSSHKNRISKNRAVPFSLFISAFLFLAGDSAGAQMYEGKRVYHLGSYHAGYEWSDEVNRGIDEVLKGTGVILKSFAMDSKRHPEEDYIRRIAQEAKLDIDNFKPDVIISSDDNAFKYVIMPFYRDSEIPVVFCGLNWDASIYEVPYSNTTGMVEVVLVEQLIGFLKQYAEGCRIGILADDNYTAKKEIDIYRKVLKLEFDDRYVRDFDRWRELFREMQDTADMLIVFNNAAINGWDKDAAVAWVNEHTKIPTGSNLEYMSYYCLATFAQNPEEQGRWAAQAALKVLDGTKVTDIPMTKNKETRFFINLSIADKLDVIIPPSKIRHAEIVQ